MWKEKSCIEWYDYVNSNDKIIYLKKNLLENLLNLDNFHCSAWPLFIYLFIYLFILTIIYLFLRTYGNHRGHNLNSRYSNGNIRRSALRDPCCLEHIIQIVHNAIDSGGLNWRQDHCGRKDLPANWWVSDNLLKDSEIRSFYINGFHPKNNCLIN